MAPFVDQGATKDLAYFVDAIGELVAAVFDMNHGVAVQEIPAIDISDPAHARARDFNEEEKPAVPRPKERGARHVALRESGLANSSERHGLCASVMPVTAARVKPLWPQCR